MTTPAALEKIQAVLRNLLAATPDVKAAAVVRVSGLTVEAIMPPHIEEERVSAMSAVMLLLGERITQAVEGGELAQVYIKGTQGHTLLVAVGHQAVLTVLAHETAPLGLLFMEMRQAAQRLRKLV